MTRLTERANNMTNAIYTTIDVATLLAALFLVYKIMEAFAGHMN